jgi:hypothetical protein
MRIQREGVATWLRMGTAWCQASWVKPALTDVATRQAVQEAEAMVVRHLNDLGVKKWFPKPAHSSLV